MKKHYVQILLVRSQFNRYRQILVKLDCTLKMQRLLLSHKLRELRILLQKNLINFHKKFKLKLKKKLKKFLILNNIIMMSVYSSVRTQKNSTQINSPPKYINSGKYVKLLNEIKNHLKKRSKCKKYSNKIKLLNHKHSKVINLIVTPNY